MGGLSRSLRGGVGGALVVGVTTIVLPWRARLREARARVYTDYLKPFHDRVNDTKNSVQDDDEPKEQPRDIGILYSALVIAATVASGYDRGRVTRFQSIWDEIGNVQSAFSEALERADGAEARRQVGHQFGVQALSLWELLNDSAKKYNDWLECELTRRWWQWRRCRGLP